MIYEFFHNLHQEKLLIILQKVHKTFKISFEIEVMERLIIIRTENIVWKFQFSYLFIQIPNANFAPNQRKFICLVCHISSTISNYGKPTKDS